MRTLGIDYGTRRIGLALSDQSGRIATPHAVLRIRSPEQAIDSIHQIIKNEDVQRVLVGVPLNMDGTVGRAARDVIAWSGSLGKKTGTQLILVDERLSSFEAEQQIALRKRAGEKITRKRKSEQLDAIAAAGLLQAFLEGRLAALEIEER